MYRSILAICTMAASIASAAEGQPEELVPVARLESRSGDRARVPPSRARAIAPPAARYDGASSHHTDALHY